MLKLKSFLFSETKGGKELKNNLLAHSEYVSLTRHNLVGIIKTEWPPAREERIGGTSRENRKLGRVSDKQELYSETSRKSLVLY